MALLGISGRIASGKDTVGKIIQYLVWRDMVESGRISLNSILVIKCLVGNKYLLQVN